jgi:hypothetical protein
VESLRKRAFYALSIVEKIDPTSLLAYSHHNPFINNLKIKKPPHNYL